MTTRARTRWNQVCGGLLFALAAGPLCAARPSQTTHPWASSATRVPVLVELFTSEGCSSCPPADRLLADLVEQQPVEGALVIGLSEHVDYWDRHGWKDPFSYAIFTRRQEAYAARFGADRIYTPQMVVGGNAEFVGSDRREALRQIKKAAAASRVPVTLEWTTPDRRTMRLLVKAGAAVNSDVWLALVEDRLSSVVTRGENQGRTLNHAAIARRLTKLGETAQDGSFSAVPTVEIEDGWRPLALTAVVFLQSRRSGHVLGAAALHR